MGRKAKRLMSQNVIVGVECPDCHEQDGTLDITAYLYDEDDRAVGWCLHCRKCENVWDQPTWGDPV